jgi:hypothetical protein
VRQPLERCDWYRGRYLDEFERVVVLPEETSVEGFVYAKAGRHSRIRLSDVSAKDARDQPWFCLDSLHEGLDPPRDVRRPDDYPDLKLTPVPSPCSPRPFESPGGGRLVAENVFVQGWLGH